MAQNMVAEQSASRRPTLLFVVAAFAIFAAETALMLALAIVHDELTVWQQALIDAVLLILVLAPVLYLLHAFSFRPMRLRITELLHFGKHMEEQIAERREVEEALRQSEKKLHQLSAQLLTVHEKERQRVSRELHEDLGQSLVVLKLMLRSMENAIHEDQCAVRKELRRASEQIDDMIRQISRLSRDLSPAILDDLGFTTAARRLVSNYAGGSGVEATLNVRDDVDAFLKGAEGIHAYRILQEALENARNHAQAGNVSVSVQATEEELLLVMEDDGRGLDGRLEPDRGLGLATMYERARMLNGSLDLQTKPGGGTRVTLKIPKSTPRPYGR